MKITREGVTVLEGERNMQNRLWTVNLANTPQAPTPTTSANNVYELTRKEDLIRYLHAACFSPTKTTWCAAITNGQFATWPGLTADLVMQHLPKEEATVKGHMRQQHQGVRSTRTVSKTEARKHEVYFQTMEITGKIASDQTGRIPVTSSRGAKYIMIVLDHDSNAILTEPLRSRETNELVRAFTHIHQYLCKRGLKPKYQRLDNEAPAALKEYMRTHDIEFQLVPPNIHRRNKAEVAIRTFKAHFIAGLCSTHADFPMHLWDRLLPQATLTLNLLWTSNINPRLSAEAQLNGAFDYNKTPLAPPGTKVIVHEKTANRKTWDPHGVDGWYVGPAMEHYRCH